MEPSEPPLDLLLAIDISDRYAVCNDTKNSLENGKLICLHCKKAFVILTIVIVTRIATVDWNSHLWQPAMGNTTHMEYMNS